MSFGRRGSSGPPPWFVFIIGIAIVFGLYYIMSGIQNFLRTGGRGVLEVTQQAEVVTSATAQFVRPTVNHVLLPTFTPAPTCTDFVVNVPNAIVRDRPSPNGAIVTSLTQNAPVCVLGRAEPDSEWYLIDQNTRTRRIEGGYMHESVIEALNPTPTPSRTPTFAPTLTPTKTPTITATPIPRPTATPNADVTETLPPPTETPAPTQAKVNI
ncbi:MAG TPA: SH3 domain-containing protein [Phototrophicaceae bacterium]|nr:SH3 domain-containing protein [Phototrophicaceae bacterium]